MQDDCKNVQNQMAELVTGTLPAEEAAELQGHVSTCAACQAYLKALQADDVLLGEFVESMQPAVARIEGKVTEALNREPSSRPARAILIWRTIIKSKVTKIAAAAVIAIALLVPLSYGTGSLIKRLIIGSVEFDEFKGNFALSKDIRFEMEVGTKEQPKIVLVENIRFFVEDEELKGTLRCDVRTLPKFKWRTKIELLDAQGRRLSDTDHVNENVGVRISYESSFPRDIHFLLGRWSNISQAQSFIVRLAKVPEETQTTPDAWLESSELDVVHGRVTGPDGKPIVNAVIGIREERKPGQMGIAAPDVITNHQGYYSYDRIKWPYTVGASVSEGNSSDQEHLFQFKRYNKVLKGSQTVDLEFGPFPTGSAIVSGKVVDRNGQITKEFRVDVRLKVDWNDYSTKYLYQFGYSKPFTAENGRFEITGLPAGVYDVSITPTRDVVISDISEFVQRRSYLCELRDGQRTEIGGENAREKVWYGRVLFEDGTPAVPSSEGLKTQIVQWTQDYTMGSTIATVDDNGYFTALISDETMERLKSGESWLTINIAKPDIRHEVQKEEMFPVELLSSERDKAGSVKISRPKVYYGRILYETGKPAVPEVLPWPGAKVWVSLRYTPATYKDGGTMERLSEVDKEGDFTAYLTDNQLEQIKTQKYTIEIYHPSYEEMNTSFPIGRYPYDMLATAKSSVKGYKLLFEQIKLHEFENLRRELESVEKLKELTVALQTYATDHEGNYPYILQHLEGYIDDLQWFIENVEYLGSGEVQTLSESAETALAYDKALLDKIGATHVLFLDGHIEFCWSRQLKALSIGESNIEISP